MPTGTNFDHNRSITVVKHYYGDYVRQIFMVAGVIMLATLPVFWKIAPTLMILGCVGVVVLVLTAGASTPKKIWTVYANAIVAIVGLLVFELSSLNAVSKVDSSNIYLLFLIINQVLSALFFFALYFAGKTVRAALAGDLVVTRENLSNNEDKF